MAKGRSGSVDSRRLGTRNEPSHNVCTELHCYADGLRERAWGGEGEREREGGKEGGREGGHI